MIWLVTTRCLLNSAGYLLVCFHQWMQEKSSTAMPLAPFVDSVAYAVNCVSKKSESHLGQELSCYCFHSRTRSCPCQRACRKSSSRTERICSGESCVTCRDNQPSSEEVNMSADSLKKRLWEQGIRTSLQALLQPQLRIRWGQSNQEGVQVNTLPFYSMGFFNSSEIYFKGTWNLK